MTSPNHTNGNDINHSDTLNNQAASKKTSGMQITRIERSAGVLLSDHMGCEIITLRVCANEHDPNEEVAIFSIHKNLLANCSRRFAKMVKSNTNHSGLLYKIHDTCPAVFKLFTEYLYKQVVPGVTHNLTPVQQGSRLADLCQLYVFAEMFEMDHIFLNKIMDKIQDGLVMTGRVLPAMLVKNIYEHGEKTSLLRKFCVASTLYAITTPGLDDTSLKILLRASDDFFDEFTRYIVATVKHNPDPRVRGSFQENAVHADLTDSSEAGSASITATRGVHPCQFHVHPHGEDAEGSDSRYEVRGCYLLDGQ
ncbi:btb poz domain containing protein [Rutstroemia sp. NJR-2017a BVV2]|nr:btb poz domain containing protein [Rutstroemia sp. NJR-2017a BVV2]PQE18396.1 btb poz domain containing protein [Rutstroemia sp. NJR-2017a BVV2]